VVIEVPTGSKNKYEFDHERHVMHLDRRLFSATVYPADYGFVPETLAEDGDPLLAEPVWLDRPLGADQPAAVRRRLWNAGRARPSAPTGAALVMWESRAEWALPPRRRVAAITGAASGPPGRPVRRKSSCLPRQAARLM
jgi:hypothetical protein